MESRSFSWEGTNILVWRRVRTTNHSCPNILARVDIYFCNKFTFLDTLGIWRSANLKANRDLRVCRDRSTHAECVWRASKDKTREWEMFRGKRNRFLQIVASSRGFLCSASSKLCSHFCQFDHANSKWEQSKQQHLLGHMYWMCACTPCVSVLMVSGFFFVLLFLWDPVSDLRGGGQFSHLMDGAIFCTV